MALALRKDCRTIFPPAFCGGLIEADARYARRFAGLGIPPRFLRGPH